MERKCVDCAVSHLQVICSSHAQARTHSLARPIIDLCSFVRCSPSISVAMWAVRSLCSSTTHKTHIAIYQKSTF